MDEKEYLVAKLQRARANGDPKKYIAAITVDDAHRSAALIKRLSAVPENARQRMYYPIVMPIDENGHGPASESRGAIRKITWEVWDQTLQSHGTFEFLLDAVQEAERLNREHYA